MGSGACPFPFAHVLTDLYVNDNSHRLGSKIKLNGTPFVCCDSHFLPFQEKVFDYVHCAHVLEHLVNPNAAFVELKRVGKIVDVITPSWIREDIFCSDPYHKWIFMKRNGRIFVRKPRKGKNFKLYKPYFFQIFTKFEYILNKISPIFIFELRIDLEQDFSSS